MVQKELAQRLKALPGSKDYGVLSLKIQYYFELEYLFTVKPHLFIPPPSVDSSVIKLKPRSKKPFLKNKNSYFELITKSFAYRRKTLRNNLKNYLGKEVIEKIDFEYYQLKMEFLNLSRRGESLDEREFVSLSNYISDNFC